MHMSLSQSQGERHVLLHTSEKTLDDNIIENIQTQVLNLWEKDPENVVLDLPEITEADPGKFGFLKDLSDQALEAGCSFVIATGNQALQSYAEDQQISFAPTQAEAVDMVFIETLERGFNQEEE